MATFSWVDHSSQPCQPQPCDGIRRWGCSTFGLSTASSASSASGAGPTRPQDPMPTHACLCSTSAMFVRPPDDLPAVIACRIVGDSNLYFDSTAGGASWSVGPTLAVPVAQTAAAYLFGERVPNDCSHLDQIDSQARPWAGGCEDCVRAGGRWVHLRMCRVCALVACCDSSPSRHARAHHASAGHPLVSSFEPGEDWWWCLEDELAFTALDEIVYSHS